ncbi:MAG: hypothetical protein K2K96_04010 [Lachnospiraceae bacterium]|nr:hypothetical protein [Lachnospiraceae bacterium]
MRKIKICLAAVICTLCFTGCHAQIETDMIGPEMPSATSNETAGDKLSEFMIDFVPNRIDLTEYQSQYRNEISEIKETSYDTISFQDCEVMPLEGIEKVGVYRLYSVDMGVDESIEIIENWLKEIGREDIDLETELRDASGQYERNESREYPYDYQAVYDYYPEFDSGHGFFVNTNQCYIQMGSDGIYSMSDGSITDFLGLDSLAAMDALGVNEEIVVDRGSISEKSDTVWELADGEMTVGDAARVVKDYFEAGTPRQNPPGISVDIPEVEVFALEDKYGYAFRVRRVYYGVPFAYAATGIRTYYSTDYEIMEDIKTAYIINHDTIAAFTGYVDAEQLEGLIEEQTEIMSLKDAVSLLNSFFAANMKLEVRKVGLVYCTYVDATGNQIAYPCWQFEGMNTTNAQMMRVYVNVLSGDVYYYSYVEG